MFGNCAIGSVGIEISPSSRMTSENTDAKIGRRRKKSTTKPWTEPNREWLLGPAGEGADFADDAARDVLHRYGSMLAQHVADPGLERVQRVEDGQRSRSSGAARAVDDLQRQPQTGVEQRIAVHAFGARLAHDAPARRLHEVGIEAAGSAHVPGVGRHRGG